MGFGGLENMNIGGTSTRSEPEFWQAGGPGNQAKSGKLTEIKKDQRLKENIFKRKMYTSYQPN